MKADRLSDERLSRIERFNSSALQYAPELVADLVAEIRALQADLQDARQKQRDADVQALRVLAKSQVWGDSLAAIHVSNAASMLEDTPTIAKASSEPNAVERFVAHERFDELKRERGRDAHWAAWWIGNAECVEYGATAAEACERALRMMEGRSDGK